MMLFMVENIDEKSSTDEKHQSQYKDILVQGTPAQPTSNQVDAFVKLVLQIVKGANLEEDRKNA